MKTVFKTPFELQVGDRVQGVSGRVYTVTALNHQPRTLGGILAHRDGQRPQPKAGAAYGVMYHHGSGISGTWDGQMGFHVIID